MTELLNIEQIVEFQKNFSPALQELYKQLEEGTSHEVLLTAVATCIGELNTLEQEVVEASVNVE